MKKKPLLFPLHKSRDLGVSLLRALSADCGKVEIRHFPDGETYLRVLSSCEKKDVILSMDLDHPDTKISTLLFLTETLRSFGARSVGGVIPYLPYMRQDRSFHKGEAITSRLFAKFVSQHLDWLVTVDPHLHRYRSLSEIYSIPTHVVSASLPISQWLHDKVKKPILIGPDRESEQWVSQIAEAADAPFLILSKKRKGDRKVVISDRGMKEWRNHTPILIDDIISSGATMVETLNHLKKAGFPRALCIGVHALFTDEVRKNLHRAGAKKVVTCNTVFHPTNMIDVAEILVGAVKSLQKKVS